MTGHGDAYADSDGLRITIDIRSVNSRYFKMSLRAAEYWGELESKIESVVKQRVRRGTVSLQLQLDRESSTDYRINQDILKSYFKQLSRLDTNLTAAGNVSLDTMLTLPGVIETESAADNSDETWKLIEATLNEALDKLQVMRQAEGQAMADDLTANLAEISTQLTQVEARAPEVIAAYQTRLTDRINKLLEKHDVTIAPQDVVREVGVFAERSDIAEECVRLRSHMKQFATIVDGPASAGKKLDFLVQEMFRETNTIGSKANDADIAKHVVEIKTCIERIREMVQNIE